MQILGEVGRRFTRKHQLHGKVNLAVEQIVLRFSVRAFMVLNMKVVFFVQK